MSTILHKEYNTPRSTVCLCCCLQDPTFRLVEAKDLVDNGLITAQEFASLKASLMQQIHASSSH